jgi:hypothetical protein
MCMAPVVYSARHEFPDDNMGPDEGPQIESKKIARLYGEEDSGRRHASFQRWFPGKRHSVTPTFRQGRCDSEGEKRNAVRDESPLQRKQGQISSRVLMTW